MPAHRTIHHSLPVQLRRNDCCSSNSSQSDDGEPIGGPDQVLIPRVPTRVKQQSRFTRIRVYASQPVGFPAVAVKTGEGEIIGVVGAALGGRDDMIYV